MKNSQLKTDQFEEKIIDIKRVSKKTKGGNKIGFAVLSVVGNREGKIGIAVGKASDTASAIGKSTGKARREMFSINMKGTTIAREITEKFGASVVLLKPAPKGAGIIAGGSVRKVIDVSGIKDISAKILGSSNKINNVYATIKALKALS
jgi:small subunit ribosomal protein S5